jgi:hypothetical protein
MAIPASTVLLVATGGVLIYAGFSNQNPLTALREVASGKPSPVRNESSVDLATYGMALGSNGVGGGIADVSYVDVTEGEGIPALPRAAERYAGDRYSQTKRWSPGYSDCSSFVGKSLKAVGIAPPPGSTTSSYLASRDWKRINGADVKAGDLAVALNHMIICYGDGTGIGQQSRRTHVKRGTVKDLMYGNTPFVYLRYAGGEAPKKSKKTKPETAWT